MANLPRGANLSLDYQALGALMRGPGMRATMTEVANEVASRVDADRVFVDAYTTDRAAASVSVYERNAEDRELITGRLADAARAVGLDVKLS